MEVERLVSGRAAAVSSAVRRRRRQLEMGQEELANRLGTSQAQVSRIEHGQANPTLQTLLKLEAILGLQLIVLEEDDEWRGYRTGILADEARSTDLYPATKG